MTTKERKRQAGLSAILPFICYYCYYYCRERRWAGLHKGRQKSDGRLCAIFFLFCWALDLKYGHQAKETGGKMKYDIQRCG